MSILDIFNKQNDTSNNDQDMECMVQKYIEIIKQKLPEFDSLRNQGAESEKIEEIEKLMKIELPQDLKKLYRIMNGDNKKVFGFMLGLNFFTMDEMFEAWESWREFDEDKELNDPRYYSSIPENAIKCQYTNKLWIPIAHDCASNYFGIDLDPGKAGTLGQIINFGRDENDKKVLAGSLKSFIQMGINYFNEFIIETIDNDTYFITNNQDTHAIDWLKKKG